MSNTADVTPYESEQQNEPIVEPAKAGPSIFALTDAERAVVAGHAETKHQERLVTARVSLRQGNAENLLNAAKSLGFSPVNAPDLGGNLTTSVELRNAKGECIALQRVGDRIDLSSANGLGAIHSVVRRTTLDLAQKHLQALSGGRVAIRQLANGEVELQAGEPAKGQRDGAALITARVDATGTARLDIENVRGARCEQVLAGFAKAVGGTARNKKLKPAYYKDPAGPGEPARVKVKG
ncbi:MAG: hypothetical protein K1X67_26720 [Fimbriimonadaceae bacterium]|nr:hypothetical protein [Fimbriimonadaceae bacterium]